MSTMNEDASLIDSPSTSVKSSSSSIADIIDGSTKTTMSRRNSLRRTLTSTSMIGGSINNNNSKLTEALKDAEVVNSEDDDHVDKFRIMLQKFMSASTFGNHNRTTTQLSKLTMMMMIDLMMMDLMMTTMMSCVA